MAAEEEMEALPLRVRLWVASEMIVLEQNNRLFHLLEFAENTHLCGTQQFASLQYFSHVFYYADDETKFRSNIVPVVTLIILILQIPLH